MTPHPNRDRIRDMTAAGLTPRQIASALHVSTQWVYQVLKELGLSPAKPRKKASA